MGQDTGPLVLIDGLNTFFRGYFRSPYMNSAGARAGGTCGMIISVRKLIGDLRATNVLVVWDGEGGSQKRRSIYSEYKAGRTVRLNKAEDDMEEDPAAQLENLKLQIENSREYLSLLGIPQVRCTGVEADDVMAFIAGKMEHKNGCVLVTTDQDLLQLIKERTYTDSFCDVGDIEIHVEHEPNLDECVKCHAVKTSEVKVWSPIKKVMYDRKKFISDYGVLPENFRLVKALTGDNSDNIDGIKGFGTKTVTKLFPFLLTKKASAKDILDAAVMLKGVVGIRLNEQKDKFLENLTLVDLSEPMLSANSAREARVALTREGGCKEVEFRCRIIKDGVTFNGNDFISPFRELAMRRKRLVVVEKPVEAVEAKE